MLWQQQRQQPRTLVRRLLTFRRQEPPPLLLFRPPSDPPATTATARSFTRHTNLAASHIRPQLPFLSVPLARRSNNSNKQQFRYLTTERKRWLAYEFLTAGKYTVAFWAILGLGVATYWSVQQEWLERRYPTPHEWRLVTRMRFRLARWAPERTDVPRTDWVQIGAYAQNVLGRLEDPGVDGAGLRELAEEGEEEREEGKEKKKSGYDLSAQSEPWRRGYYECLMLCARAAEHLDDQVVDTTRHLVFPADQVRGPSNPDPRPIAPGSPPAPREEDCERAYEPPEAFYWRVLNARGFTDRQKMDAALAYAAWLDFKGAPGAAAEMYERALSLASSSEPPPYDPKSYVLRETSAASGKPSANVLTCLTELAVHKARTGDVTAALPILISILRARRSLPSPQSLSATSGSSQRQQTSAWTKGDVASMAKRIIFEPAYPPPPDDGGAPPARDAKELCEEAGLNLYIGEIIYASQAREDGLAWTREAVDLAEEQLHKLGAKNSRRMDEPAKKTCKECLEAGLQNWSKMVERLARAEREQYHQQQQQGGQKKGWLGLWGEGSSSSKAEEDAVGRWTAEEQVVKERMRRATEILEELEAPRTGLGAIFWA